MAYYGSKTMIIRKSCGNLFTGILFAVCVSGVTSAHAESARQLCETPVFQDWKQQQSERLWAPDAHTEKAEQAGMVFSYNCFTFEEIDRFYDMHYDRIENAHFYPILKSDRYVGSMAEKDDDC